MVSGLCDRSLDSLGSRSSVPPAGARLCVSLCSLSVTRSLNTLLTANWDGAKFQGPLKELQPGVGYEVYVAEEVTFAYDVYGQSASASSALAPGGPSAGPGQWAGQRLPQPAFVDPAPAP